MKRGAKVAFGGEAEEKTKKKEKKRTLERAKKKRRKEREKAVCFECQRKVV